MHVNADFIMGLSLGCEYVAADEEAGVDCSYIVIDFFVIRFLIELTDE